MSLSVQPQAVTQLSLALVCQKPRDELFGEYIPTLIDLFNFRPSIRYSSAAACPPDWSLQMCGRTNPHHHQTPPSCQQQSTVPHNPAHPAFLVSTVRFRAICWYWSVWMVIKPSSWCLVVLFCGATRIEKTPNTEKQEDTDRKRNSNRYALAAG